MSTASTRTKLVLGPEMNGIILTPEEFDAVEDYDENYRYELIHGVLIVSSIPIEATVGSNEMLGHELLDYQQHHPQGYTRQTARVMKVWNGAVGSACRAEPGETDPARQVGPTKRRINVPSALTSGETRARGPG